MLLAGDIGGTKTNLAIFSTESGPGSPLVEETFPSGNYVSLEAMVEEFLVQTDLEVTGACFGVAGPVVDGQAKITNLPWVIDEARLKATLNLKSARLLNDLLSIAYAVPLLMEIDVEAIKPGTPKPGGAIAVVAPGTGLGEAYLTWDGTRYHAHPSEGGHVGFAPNSELEISLLCYLQEKFGHVSFERVCSGRGIPNIYSFLKDTGYAEEPDWLARHLTTTQDPTPVIVNTALDQEQPSKLCSATLSIFVSILGAEAGNMALKVLASGGVYLAGGIPPRILPLLQEEHFLQSFRCKGRMADLLEDIPIYVITHPKVALLGAAAYGLQTFTEETP